MLHATGTNSVSTSMQMGPIFSEGFAKQQKGFAKHGKVHSKGGPVCCDQTMRIREK